jgi:predicted amidohydrolase YtcJ
MTVLSADLTAVPKAAIKDIEVLMTVTGGKIVFSKL